MHVCSMTHCHLQTGSIAFSCSGFRKYSNFILSPHCICLERLNKHFKSFPVLNMSQIPLFAYSFRLGPGILSKELLNAGAQRLISIERNSEFLPRLKELQNDSDGRLLQALHADFYKMQYHGDTPYARPVIRIKELFQDISPVSWESGNTPETVLFFS